jgi:hypothetical protein
MYNHIFPLHTLQVCPACEQINGKDHVCLGVEHAPSVEHSSPRPVDAPSHEPVSATPPDSTFESPAKRSRKERKGNFFTDVCVNSFTAAAKG